MRTKDLLKRWLVTLLCVAMVVGSVPMPTEAAVILDSSNEAQDLLEVVDEDTSTEATDVSTSESKEDSEEILLNESDSKGDVIDTEEEIKVSDIDEEEATLDIIDEAVAEDEPIIDEEDDELGADSKENPYCFEDENGVSYNSLLAALSDNRSLKMIRDYATKDLCSPEHENAKINIDLNGHKLDAIIAAKNGLELTVSDNVEPGDPNYKTRYLTASGKIVEASTSSDDIPLYGGVWTNSSGVYCFSAISKSVSLNVTGVTFAGTENSAIILYGNDNNLNVYGNTAFVGCRYGGAIFAYGGATLNIGDSASFTGCTADRDGGAIYAEDGATVNIGVSASFTGCTADADGGAIYAGSESTSVNICGAVNIEDCGAGFGGALYANGSTVNIGGNASIVDCEADDNGGAITVQSDSTVILSDNCIISGNHVKGKENNIYCIMTTIDVDTDFTGYAGITLDNTSLASVPVIFSTMGNGKQSIIDEGHLFSDMENYVILLDKDNNYCLDAIPTIAVISNNKVVGKYSKFKNAVEDCVSGNTIKLLDDVKFHKDIVFFNGKEYILDLNGYILDAQMELQKGATLTVKDSNHNSTHYLEKAGNSYTISKNSTGLSDEIPLTGGILTNSSEKNVIYSNNTDSTLNL